MRGTQLLKAISTKFNVHFFVLFFIILFSVSILPCTWKWELHRGIVPPEEDYFDYSLVQAALCPISRQYLTLTREDVGKFQFSDFKVHAKHKSFASLGYRKLVCVYIKALSRSIKLYYDEQQRNKNRKRVPCFYQVLVEFAKYQRAYLLWAIF